MEEQNGNTRALWQLLKPHKPQKKSFVLLTVLVLIATSLELVIPLYSSHLIDSISAQGVEFAIIVGLIAIVLTAAVFETVLGWFGGKLGHTISRRLRYSLIGRLLNSQSQSLDDEHSAELSARVVNDSKEVKTVLAEDLIGLISGVVSLVAVIAIMFVLDWRLTLVLVSCVLIGFIIITPLALMMNGIGKATQNAEASLLKYITEWMRFGKLVKSHNAASQLQQQSSTLLAECFKQEMRATKVLALIGPITNLVLMMSMVAILGFSTYWLQQGSMSLGTITAFLMYLFGLTFPLMSMAMFFSNLNKAAGAATRMSEISQIPIESHNCGSLLSKVDNINIKNLHFSRADKNILKDINYTFNASGLTILMGESGSGKSTFLNQLLGFYPETFSSIFINGQCMSEIDLHSLRQCVAWVDQEPKLLHASIRENLTLGLNSSISDEQIIQTLESVGLQSWLTRIEHNFDAVVSEQANQFSGGEKQRFAIGRAILRNASVLLLDEPTSALDDINKIELMRLLRQLATHMRVIIISHHKELIEENDEVLEMKAGELSVYHQPT